MVGFNHFFSEYLNCFVMIDDTLAYKHSIVKVVVFVGHSSALSGHYERNSRLTKKKHSNKIAKFYSCHLNFFF